jgi:hypothetical protein
MTVPAPDPALAAMLVTAQLIEDAISYRQALAASCADCAPGGDRCAPCERDATAVRIYQGQLADACRDALALGAADAGLVTDGGCPAQPAGPHRTAILDCVQVTSAGRPDPAAPDGPGPAGGRDGSRAAGHRPAPPAGPAAWN